MSLISKRVNSYNQILIIIILYPVLVSGAQRDGTARRRRRDPQPRSRGGRHLERDACPGRVSAWGASRFGFVFRVSGLGLSPLCRFERPFPLSNHTFGYSTVVRTVHVHAVGNSGWRPHRSEKDNMVGPKLMQTSQHLREHAALLAASSTHTQAPIAAWKVHDYCNLVTLPVVVVLTGLSLTSPPLGKATRALLSCLHCRRCDLDMCATRNCASASSAAQSSCGHGTSLSACTDARSSREICCMAILRRAQHVLPHFTAAHPSPIMGRSHRPA